MTLVATKKQFIKYLENQINDDAILIFTNDLTGEIASSIKKNTKSVGFNFAADDFSKPYDIGHIAFGKTPSFAVCVCKLEDVSPTCLQKIVKAENQTATTKENQCLK